MSRNSQFESQALQRLSDLASVAVEHIAERQHDQATGTALVSAHSERIPVEVRRIAAPSRFLIESTIVHHAAERRLCGRSVILISVSRLVPRMLDRVDELLQPFTGDVDWAIISDAGGCWLHLPYLGITRVEKDNPSRVVSVQDRPARMEFSDAAVGILKVLLLSRLPGHPTWWSGPRGPIRSGVDLAEKAQVSPSMVYHVLGMLRRKSWLRDVRSDDLVVTRPRALLDAWLSQSKNHTPIAIPVRPLYGDVPQSAGTILDWLTEHGHHGPDAERWAVNGWMACRIHHTGFVTDLDQRMVSIACVGDPQRLITSWKLMRCDDVRDAMFVIEPMLSSRAITLVSGENQGQLPGPAVIAQPLPVVDVIQAALDVARDPARGIDQAEHICGLITAELEGVS